MDESDPKNIAAPCGIFCAACSRCSENSLCRGCRLDIRHNKCDIYECCVIQGGKDFCYECECFPCARLKEFAAHGAGKSFAHHRHVTIDSLILLRGMGLEQWSEMMRRRAGTGEYAVNRKNSDGTPDDSPCPCEKT